MLGKGRLYVLAAAGVSALAAGSYAVAGSLNKHDDGHGETRFHATLDGYEEVPSVSSTGWGEFDAQLVEDEKIHFVFRYAGLEGGNSLFAHVHFGQLSVNGGVSFFLCGGPPSSPPAVPKPACPNVEGTVEGDITPADVVGPNGQGIEPSSFAEIVRAMRAGKAYANIHTVRWGGGEIRGQITTRHGDDDRDDRGKDDDGSKGDDKAEIRDKVKDEIKDVKAEIKDELNDDKEKIREKVRKAFDQ